MSEKNAYQKNYDFFCLFIVAQIGSAELSNRAEGSQIWCIGEDVVLLFVMLINNHKENWSCSFLRLKDFTDSNFVFH